MYQHGIPARSLMLILTVNPHISWFVSIESTSTYLGVLRSAVFLNVLFYRSINIIVKVYTIKIDTLIANQLLSLWPKKKMRGKT